MSVFQYIKQSNVRDGLLVLNRDDAQYVNDEPQRCVMMLRPFERNVMFAIDPVMTFGMGDG